MRYGYRTIEFPTATAMNISAIALDIDGTILTDAKQVAPGLASTIPLLLAKQLSVFLVSARPPRSVADFQNRLRLPGPLVALNGGLVLDSSKEICARKSLDENCINQVATLIKEFPGLECNVYSNFRWWSSELGPWNQEEANLVGFEPDEVGEASRPRSGEKILVRGEPELLAKCGSTLAKRICGVRSSFSGPTYLEVTAPDASKLAGIYEVTRLLKISPENVLAVGDSDSDAEMIRECGFGVSMGNGSPAAKEAADQIIGSNNSDSLTRFLEERFLR